MMDLSRNVTRFPLMGDRYGLLVDNWYPNPKAVRAEALNSRMEKHPRLPLFRGEARPAVQWYDAIENLIGRKIEKADSHFQLMFSKEALPEEQFVHGDESDWMGVCFLSEGYNGCPGTHFFRHRRLGLETRDPIDIIFRSLELDADVASISKEIVDDAYRPDRWERIHTVDYRFNRLVLFPGVVLHSPAQVWGSTWEDARMTEILNIRCHENRNNSTITSPTRR